MIYPTEALILITFSNGRRDALIYFNREGKRLFKMEVKNISPQKFKDLSVIVDKFIEINNNENLIVKFGIEEIQEEIEEFI